jgi:hypothetical protein
MSNLSNCDSLKKTNIVYRGEKMLTSNNTGSQASSANSYLLTELTQHLEEVTEQELKLVIGGAAVLNTSTRPTRPTRRTSLTPVIRLPIDPQPQPLPEI